MRGRRAELGVLLAVVGAWIGGVLATDAPGAAFDRFDRRAYDLAVRHALPAPAAPEAITVVLVDDESLARLGERWPMSRDRWAAFVSRVTGFGPAAVALDAWFESPAPREDVELALDVADLLRDPALGMGEAGGALADKLDRLAARRDGDRALAEAISRAGAVVLGVACTPQDRDARGRAGLADSRPLPLDAPPGRALACAQVAGNIPRLARSARAHGGVNLAPDEDGISRRHPYVFGVEGQSHPSLALAAAQVADPAGAAALLERAVGADRGAPVLFGPPAGAFRTVRFSDVLEAETGDALVDAFAGRIVLVGVSALGTEDFSGTPRERQVAGVFVHAQALANLLDGGFLRTEGPLPRRALWAALVGVALTAALAWPIQSGAGLLLLGLSLVAGWIGAWLSLIGQGVIGPLWPFAGGVAAWLAVRIGFGYARAQAARARENEIRRAFQHYLAPEVVQTLVDDPARLRLGGERRMLTAFFSDIRGFSTVAEALDPAELVQLLNACLGRMTEIILDEGGTIDKYIGDAVVAMFGAPVAEPEHALRACRAALRCQAAMVELRRGWAARGLPELHVRIGLNSGVALVGNMGSEQRFDYTMIGDAVNLAARLEHANTWYGTGILAGEETMELVGEAVVFREVDRVRARGRQQAVRIGEVVALAAEATVEQRTRAEQYALALAAYRARRWADARAALAPLVAVGDGPALRLAERAERYAAAPPPADWDAVFTMSNQTALTF